MGRELKKMSNGALELPDDFVDRLTKGMSSSPAMAGLSYDGKAILKMDHKSGEWAIGIDETPPEDDALFVANLFSFQHGWVCWINQKPKLVMVSMEDAMPEQPDPISDGSKMKDFQECLGFEAAIINGEDKGLEVVYRQNSYGGKKGVRTLCEIIKARTRTERVYAFPIFRLSSDSYIQKEFGETFNPIFEVIGWANGNCEREPDKKLTAEIKASVAPPEPEPKPVRQTRARKAPADIQPAVVQAAPAPTQQLHQTGQRRRPGR